MENKVQQGRELWAAYEQWKSDPKSLDDLEKFNNGLKTVNASFRSVWRTPYSRWTDEKWDVDTKAMANDLQMWFNLPDKERTDRKWVDFFKKYFLE